MFFLKGFVEMQASDKFNIKKKKVEILFLTNEVRFDKDQIINTSL